MKRASALSAISVRGLYTSAAYDTEDEVPLRLLCVVCKMDGWVDRWIGRWMIGTKMYMYKCTKIDMHIARFIA